jgi:hypothetical protein
MADFNPVYQPVLNTSARPTRGENRVAFRTSGLAPATCTVTRFRAWQLLALACLQPVS